jgi:hypothetical protein
MTLVPKCPVNSHHLYNSCQWQLHQINQWYLLVVRGKILRSEVTESSFKTFFCNLIELEILQTIECVKFGNFD